MRFIRKLLGRERKDLVLPIEKRVRLPGDKGVEVFDLTPHNSGDVRQSIFNFFNMHQGKTFSEYGERSYGDYDLNDGNLVFDGVDNVEGLKERELHIKFHGSNNPKRTSLCVGRATRFAFLPRLNHEMDIGGLYIERGYLILSEDLIRGGPNPFFGRTREIYVPNSF